jgi:DNA gyrase subunit A
MVVVRPETRDDTSLLAVTELGRGKRTLIDEYPLQSRGGLGVINFRLNEQTGSVIAIKGVADTDELVLITRAGVMNRQRIGEVRVIGRATQGVRVIALDDDDRLVDIARVVPDDEEDEVIEEAVALSGVIDDGDVASLAIADDDVAEPLDEAEDSPAEEDEEGNV